MSIDMFLKHMIKISDIDIGEEKFNSIIDSTVSRKSFEARFRNIFEKNFFSNRFGVVIRQNSICKRNDYCGSVNLFSIE